MKRIFKKRIGIILMTLALCCVFAVPTLAADVTIESPVGVFVEYVEEDGLLVSSSTFGTTRTPEVTDLSTGSVTYSAGVLEAGATYTSGPYSITKQTIKIGFHSMIRPSYHIRVTLYRTTSSYDVAVSTITIPVSSAMQPISTYVNFTNLNTNYDYYFVIENIDSKQSGLITGNVSQK